jgi:hypothetical protein
LHCTQQASRCLLRGHGAFLFLAAGGPSVSSVSASLGDRLTGFPTCNLGGNTCVTSANGAVYGPCCRESCRSSSLRPPVWLKTPPGWTRLSRPTRPAAPPPRCLVGHSASAKCRLGAMRPASGSVIQRGVSRLREGPGSMIIRCLGRVRRIAAGGMKDVHQGAGPWTALDSPEQRRLGARSSPYRRLPGTTLPRTNLAYESNRADTSGQPLVQCRRERISRDRL